MVVTDDDALAEQIRLLRSHGMTTLSWDRHRGHATGYDVVALGFNYRIDEPRAAFAEQRLRRLDDENLSRARLADRYRDALAQIPGLRPALPPVADAVLPHHLFTVVADPEVDRDGLRAALAERGVQTSLHYPPVHGFSIYADGDFELPVTESYAARAVTLPIFGHMTDAQQDLVLESLRSAVSGAAPVR